MTRPLVFFSHSALDLDVVSELRQWISEALNGGADFFQSSDDDSLVPGTAWFHEVVGALKRCDIVLVVATPNMLRSNWAFFEAGGGHLLDVQVVPVCGYGVPLSGLPTPLNELTAVDVSTDAGRRQLITLLAKAANTEAPETVPSLGVHDAPPLVGLDMVGSDAGFLGMVSHQAAVQMFFDNMLGLRDVQREILLSGASLTDFVHLRTNALAHASGGACLERISVVIKAPDPWWSETTHRGMGFRPPYDASDSAAMLVQARRDLLVLAEQIGETRAQVELKESPWPPTYASGVLVAPDRTFAFFEPFFFGHPLVDRLCFIFAEGAPGSSEFVAMLRQTHDRMVADGATVSL